MIKSCPGQFYAGRRLIKKSVAAQSKSGCNGFNVMNRYFAISSASILIQ